MGRALGSEEAHSAMSHCLSGGLQARAEIKTLVSVKGQAGVVSPLGWQRTSRGTIIAADT